MSEDKEESKAEFDAGLEEAQRWLNAMPADDHLVGLLCLRMLKARGAVSPDTVVPSDEMEFCCKKFSDTIFAMRMFRLLAIDLVACGQRDNELEWWATDEGKRLAVHRTE